MVTVSLVFAVAVAATITAARARDELRVGD
jgi:hypothetical protein